MRKRLIYRAIASSLVLFSAQAAAVPFGSVDPRSMAMGGVGVASGTSANAGFLNPALLAAAQSKEDFSLELPIIYARVSDPDKLIDEIDNYQNDDLEGKLTASIDAYTATPTNQNAAQVGADAEALLNQLLRLTNKTLEGEFAGGFVVGIPSKKFGASLTIGARAVGGGVLDVTDEDQARIQQIIDDALAGTAYLITNPDVADQIAGNNIVDKLTSNLQARGAILAEVGLSLAREFNVGGHDVAIGITPKLVKVTTFDYRLDVNTAEFNADEGQKEYSNINFDLGLAKDYNNGWKVGFSVKNLISQEYKTVLGHTVAIDPQARVGISHATEWVTVAVDADLNPAEPVSYGSATQYVGIGAELDIWDTVQLRVGYRHNLKDSDTSVPTVGIGFSPFGVHIDLAAAANDNETAVSGQLGFRF